MVVSGQERALDTLALATRFRHAADETSWPDYRAKLLKIARELEVEAGRLEIQEGLPLLPRGASRAG